MPEPKIDTSYLKDHALTRGFMLGRPVKPRPTPDGRAVLFLRARSRSPQLTLHELDVASGKSREVLTPAQLLQGGAETVSADEKARRERQRISVGGFTDFQLSDDGRRVLVALSGRLYLLERGGPARALPVPAGALDARFSPDGLEIAYVREHDLRVLDLESGKERRITEGGAEHLTHGLAEFVAQEEMGRMSGWWWSPDGQQLAYEEADSRGVETWWVADPARPGQPPHAARYPRPGHANVVVRLGVVSARGGETVWARWDARRYEYVTQVRWEAHGPLTIAVQTRDQREVALLSVDAETGETTRLLVEKDPAWMPVKRDVPRWVGPREGFVWWREVAGQRRLELRAPDGKVTRVLHRQRGGPLEVLDLDRAGGWLYFRSGTEPHESHVHRVSLAGGKPEVLTSAPGVHSAVVARGGPPRHGGGTPHSGHGGGTPHSGHAGGTPHPGGAPRLDRTRPLLVVESALRDAMPRATVHGADGALLCAVPSVAEEPPFRPRAELELVAKGSKDAPGGYHAAITRPRAFDAARRYPVLVDVYGGPGHNKVLSSMGTRLVDQWLADQGFVVVSVDNRGTPGRSRAWERPLKGHVGTVPLADQIAGLKALGRAHPEMDLERVGIVGWSYGGYMSALAVLERPDVFRAAVSGAPVVDWLDYDTHYTERYLGLPDKAPRAYREASLLPRAERLERPLLIVHGTADDNVFFVHALKLADALFRSGRPFELLPLAGLTHMVPEPVVAERLWGRIAAHFVRHLGGPETMKSKAKGRLGAAQGRKR